MQTQPSDRLSLCLETTILTSMTAVSSILYLAGDGLSRLSKLAYRYGTDMDSVSLQMLGSVADKIDKFIWKDLHD